MRLPVMPPVKPMLAKAVVEVPNGDLSFEPKWDGFRGLPNSRQWLGRVSSAASTCLDSALAASTYGSNPAIDCRFLPDNGLPEPSPFVMVGAGARR